MGYQIKRNKKGEYKIISSTSDEPLCDGWISENEAKKILIENEYWKFVRESIQISMEFPNGYQINGKEKVAKGNEHMKGMRWIIDNWNEKKFKTKFKEICKELDVDIKKFLK